MKPARFHSEAEAELEAEASYYEGKVPGLGKRFAQDVQEAVRLACTFPGIGSPYKYGTRRVFPRRFPFSVVYLPLPSEIVILAVAPFARKPGYWRSRKSVV